MNYIVLNHNFLIGKGHLPSHMAMGPHRLHKQWGPPPPIAMGPALHMQCQWVTFPL